MKPIDLHAREVYDGFEPSDYAAPLASPEALGLSASDLCRTRLLELGPVLGDAALELICRTSGLTRTGGDFAAIVDSNRLCVYGLVRKSADGVRELVVTSFGEFQPARYCGFVLSVWRL